MQARERHGSRIAPESGPVGPSRYDLVLAVIPVVLLASALLGLAAGPMSLALACGGVAAGGATAYGLFVEPPAKN